MERADWWRMGEYRKGESQLVEDRGAQKRGEPIGGRQGITEKERADWQWT